MTMVVAVGETHEQGGSSEQMHPQDDKEKDL